MAATMSLPPPCRRQRKVPLQSEQSCVDQPTGVPGVRGTHTCPSSADAHLSIGRDYPCIESLGMVSSLHEGDTPSSASPKHMPDKKLASRATRQARPKVRATRSGVLYVDVQELYESEAGQRALEKAEKLRARLGSYSSRGGTNSRK